MANKLRITHVSKKSGASTIIFDNTISSGTVINGDGVLVTGVPITETMDDGMNSAVLNLRGCNGEAIPELFQPYDVIDISQNGSAAVQWLVAIDQRQIDNAYEKTYEKTVSLVEPTKFLDTIYIYNCNLTNKSGTLNDQVLRLLTNAEIKINSEIQRLSIISGTDKILTQFPSEDFFFDNVTLREALYRIFECAHIRPYVPQLLFTSGDISDIRIGHKSKNEFTDITSLEGYGEYLGDEGEISIDNYFGTLKARGYNSVVKNVQKTGIRPFTTTEATLTDDNVLADLGLPIEDIRKFQVGGTFKLSVMYVPIGSGVTSIEVFIYIGNPGTNVTYYDGSFFWDISESLIDNELYECLSTDEKDEYMPYTRGSTVIGMSKTYKTVLSTKSTIKTVINKNNAEPGEINGTKYNYKGSQIYKFLKTNNIPDSTGRTDYLNDSTTWTSVTIKSPISGLYFQAEFIPRIDTVIEVSKPGVYDNDRLRIGVLDGQNANSIDILRHGRSLGSLARRTGNEELKLDFHCDDFSQLMPVMGRFKGLTGRNTYLNGYVITKREYGIYDNELKVRYYCTKDFQAMNERIGVNREKRLYNIPLEASDCPVHIKYYVTISRYQPSYQNAQPSEFLLKLVSGITGNTRDENTRVSFMYLTPNVVVENKDVGTYAMPCLAYAADKTVVFMAQPLDNYSVGYTRGGRKIDWINGGGMTMIFNKYVDNNGEFENPVIKLASSQAVAGNVNSYPKVTEGGESTLSNPITVRFVKDRTQRPVFFVDFEFLPAEDSYGDIVFGEAVASQNSQVIAEEQSARFVFVGGKTYNSGDTKVYGSGLTGTLKDYFKLATDENGKVILTVQQNIVLTTGKHSIAIGDTNGNLIIGFNNMNLSANQKFYFDVRRTL